MAVKCVKMKSKWLSNKQLHKREKVEQQLKKKQNLEHSA